MRDKLPRELNMQLRMNRRGSSLPDCQGDMWMQLVQAHEQEAMLLEGDKRTVEKRIRSMLQLGSKDTFPAGRVVTLWRNERWREMLTRWYGTQLGRETLHNISPCEWMASLQIDGVSMQFPGSRHFEAGDYHDSNNLWHAGANSGQYWFSTFEGALRTLSELHAEAGDCVNRADWAEMVKALGRERVVQQQRSRLCFIRGRTGEQAEDGKSGGKTSFALSKTRCMTRFTGEYARGRNSSSRTSTSY